MTGFAQGGRASCTPSSPKQDFFLHRKPAFRYQNKKLKLACPRLIATNDGNQIYFQKSTSIFASLALRAPHPSRARTRTSCPRSDCLTLLPPFRPSAHPASAEPLIALVSLSGRYNRFLRSSVRIPNFIEY